MPGSFVSSASIAWPLRRHVDALREGVPRRRLVDVEDELLVSHREAALEPAGRVEHEVDAPEHRRLHRVRRLVGRLGVGDLRRGQGAAGAERHTESPGERRHHVEDQRRLGGAERRRARLHRHRRGERAEDHRSAGPDELAEGHPGERLGERLGGGTDDGGGAHRAGEDERRDQDALVGLGVRLRRPEHRRVPDHRRVGVRERHDHRVRLEEVGAEEDPRHRDRVLGPARVRDGAHEGLVRVAHVRVDHVVVPLVDGDVDGLADGASRVMEERRHVGELHEVAEVLDRPVAATVVEVAHERGAVRGSEHGVHAADLDVVRGVARDLGELGRCGRLDELARESTREPHALAVDVGARVLEQGERLRRVAEVDPDLLEHGVRVLLDQRQVLLREHLEGLHRSRDVGDADGVRDRTRGLSRGAAAASATSGCLGHAGLLWLVESGRERRRARPSVASATRRGGRVTTVRSRS